jgi:hypothetical protein
MADKKISALTAASTPLAGTEVLPIVQSGATVKVAVSDLTAGRAISATQITLTAGNVIPANGYGIDFSATSGSGTSELFNDYEEGTWTPNQGAGLTVIGTFSSSGLYTKVGRLVTVEFSVSGSTSVAILTDQLLTSNLPFTAGSSLSVGALRNANNSISQGVQIASTSVYIAGPAISATASITVTATYSV